jgi:aspartyl protease family protein
MRIFFLLTVVLAVAVGWIAGRPTQTTNDPLPKPETASVALPPEQAGWPGTVVLDRHDGGHFIAAGAVNGHSLGFVVDTGASSVALSRTDAARAGIIVSEADFDAEAQTASGTIRVAHVRLPRVKVGTIELNDVSAVVLDVSDAMPLLGQSFLGRIDKVSIEQGRMTLTKL